MLVFTIRIEHALDVSVQRPHDADTRKHRRPARRRDQDQGFGGGLPCRSLLLGFWQFSDVGAGVF
jgi:hypothetical protein